MSESQSNAQSTIHRQMTIKHILSAFPQKAQRLAQEITSAGLHCVGCQASTWETLEAGMLGHGMSNEMIDQLVNNLNRVMEEKTDETTVSFTPRGSQKYLSILQEDGKAGWGIRLSHKMAGCSGFEYVLDYSEKAKEDDEIFESMGIQIHINKNSAKYFLGCLIDYVDGLHGSGFKISNPNVKSSCGCGSSHNY